MKRQPSRSSDRESPAFRHGEDVKSGKNGKKRIELVKMRIGDLKLEKPKPLKPRQEGLFDNFVPSFDTPREKRRSKWG